MNCSVPYSEDDSLLLLFLRRFYTALRDSCKQLITYDDTIHLVLHLLGEDWLLKLASSPTTLNKGKEHFPFEIVSFVDQWRPIDLAYFSERLISKEAAQKGGIYYTPDWLVDQMVDISFRQLFPLSGDNVSMDQLPSVLDPAIGGGVFVSSLLRKFATLAAQRKTTVSSKTEELERYLMFARRVVGVDKNPLALSVSKGVLTLDYIGIATQIGVPIAELPPLPLNLIEGNSITARHLTTPLEESSCFFPYKSFDLVIGNPPYGMSRGARYDQSELTTVKDRFSQYQLAKVNKYMAFMALGLELLNENGVMSFVVPNSWLGIEAASKLRAEFFSKGKFLSFDMLHKDTFNTGGLETISFLYRRSSKSASKTMVRKFDREGSVLNSWQIDSREFSLRGSKEISLVTTRECTNLFRTLSKNAVALGGPQSPFLPRIALQAYAVGRGQPMQTLSDVQNKVFHSETRNGANWHVYINGSDISRYKVQWSGTFLHYGRHLSECQPLNYYSGPRIVVREVLGRWPHFIQAAFLDQTAIYNKSVLHIIWRNSDLQGCPEGMMLALLGILNSSLGSYYLANFGKKAQRSIFPKLLANDLKEFPIPMSLSDEYRDLAALVKTRNSLSATSPLLRRSEDVELKKIGADEGFESLIDKEVCRLYGVAEADLKQLWAELPRCIFT